MIAAVLLAAGESRRMGSPKLALPWRGEGSLIAALANTFVAAAAAPVIVVTGGDRQAVERTLDPEKIQPVFNPDYASSEMLGSIQAGLGALEDEAIEAAFICPGDLPFLQVETVRGLRQTWERRRSRILAPSFERRRGHPVLFVRALWPEILALEAGETLRDYMHRRSEWIEYMETKDAGVLKDIDTPADYEEAKNGEGASER